MSSRTAFTSVRFWDRIAERYAKKPVADPAAYETKLELTREHLTPTMRLLEFGCGTGTTAIAHAPRVAHIRAIDVSPRMIAIARGKAEQAGVTNVAFEVGVIDALEVPEGTYGMVMAHSILHLLEDKDAVLQKVHAMLEPGGVFVSSTACIADHMPLFRFVAPIGAALRLIPNVRVFGEQDLVESVEAAGFTIERTWRPKPDSGVFLVARRA